MSKILAMAEPYEKIRTLSTLRSEFMDKYNALKAQEIAPAKDYVQAAMTVFSSILTPTSASSASSRRWKPNAMRR